MHLRDTLPLDLLLTACYLAAIGLSVLAGWRTPDHDRLARRIWFGIGACLAALLVNQQTDIYLVLLGGLHDRLEQSGVPLLSTPCLAVFGLAFLAGGFAFVWVLVRLRGRSSAPGSVASTGLILLGVFALVRGARLVHVLQGYWADEPLLFAGKGVELAGLMLVSLGAWRWQSNPTPGPRVALGARPPI